MSINIGPAVAVLPDPVLYLSLYLSPSKKEHDWSKVWSKVVVLWV